MTHFFGNFLDFLLFRSHPEASFSAPLTPIGLVIKTLRTNTSAGPSHHRHRHLALNLKKNSPHTQATERERQKLFRVVFLQLFSWEGTGKRLEWENLKEPERRLQDSLLRELQSGSGSQS